jgi:hypothetical protein
MHRIQGIGGEINEKLKQVTTETQRQQFQQLDTDVKLGLRRTKMFVKLK